MKIILKFLLIWLILWPVLPLYGSENMPSEKAYTSKNAPTKNTNPSEKITKNIPAIGNETVSEVGGPPTTHQTENQGKKEPKSPNESLWHKFISDPLAIFTGLLFIATCLLFWATRQLVLGAEKTANQQLRAYVFMKLEDGTKMFYDTNGCLSAPLIIKNFGQTPAYEFISWLHIGLYKFPLDTKLDQPSYLPTASKAPIAPSDTIRQYATLPTQLNKTEIVALRNETAAIFVCGEVFYVDAFKIKQRSNICLYSTGEDFARGELAYYHEGNEAT